MQPDTIIPDLSNPQSWNRYSYVTNRPLYLNDPSGHDPWGCDDKSVSCDEKYITDEAGTRGGPIRSFDGGWNEYRYSTWNLLRKGSPCTACHVTHDQPGDWTIPTNEEIDRGLVQNYRNQDKTGRTVHWAALSYVGTNTYLARETVVIGHYAESPNYVEVAKGMGAQYFQVDAALTTEQVTLANENFIVNNVENGSRFVQSSFPVRAPSGLNNEIGWLTGSGYSSAVDMVTEVSTSVVRAFFGLFGLSQDK